MKRIDKDSKIGFMIHTYGPLDAKVYFNHMGTMRSWASKYNIFFCGIDKHRTADARNILVQTAISAGCTHLVSIDADHIIPEHMLDVLSKNDGCQIASGLICKRKPPYGQVGFLKLEDGFHQVTLPIDNKSYMVSMPAMGCTLFDVEVFKKLDAPWFLDSIEVKADGEIYNKRSDSNFFAMCDEAGIKMVIDTRVIIGHVGDAEVVYPGQQINVAKMNQENNIRMDADSLTWQKPVYDKAHEFVEDGSVKSVLDLGCGNPIKLRSFAGAVDLIGIDYPNKIADISRRGVEGQWIGKDLNQPFDLHRKFDLIIAADVIEHLNSVTNFFKIINTHLANSGKLLISTPNKKSTGGSNILHVQEFNVSEFSGILAAHGFWHELEQYTEKHDNIEYTNMMAVCKRLEK